MKWIIVLLLGGIVCVVLPLGWEPVFPSLIKSAFTLGHSIPFIFGWWVFLIILVSLAILFFRSGGTFPDTRRSKITGLAFVLTPFLLCMWVPVYTGGSSRLMQDQYHSFLHSEFWQYILFFIVVTGMVYTANRVWHVNGKDSKTTDAAAGDKWSRVLYVFLFCYLAGVLAVALYEYSIFENWEDMDTNVQSYAQTLKGNFFVSYLERASYGGMNVMLGTHTRPILLLILPFYALFQTGATLLVFKSVFMTASAIPMYYLFRQRMDAPYAFALVASYLFFPPFMSQHFSGFHEVCLAPLLVASTLYYFEKKNLRWFLVFYILCLMVKEHVAFILLPFAFIALLRRRNWSWVIFPVALSAVWAAVTFGYIIPAYRPDDCLIYAHYSVKSHDHPGIGGLVTNILMNPGDTFQLINKRFYYLFVYFSQSGFILPFLTPECVFLVLPLVKNVLFFPYDPPVTFHHSMVSAALLFYITGIIVSRIIARIDTVSSGFARAKKFLVVFFITGTMVVNMPIWVRTVNLTPAPELPAMKEALELIPDGVRVAAPMNMTHKLASRCEVVWFDYRTIKGENAADYVIINAHRDFRLYKYSPKKKVLDTGHLDGYTKVWEKDGIIVFELNPEHNHSHNDAR